MKYTNWLILLFGIFIMISCKDQSKSQLTDEEIWKLGWRITINSMDDKFILAEAQFDSLLNLTEDVDKKFLIYGLEVKSKLNKTEEVAQILGRQDQEMLNELCQQDFLNGTAPCLGIDVAKPKNEVLQLELVKMYINDQYIRKNLMEDLLEKYNLVKNEVIIDSFGTTTDEDNRNRLKEIIEEFGFPNLEMVGKDAMKGVFYMIQHSDGDKEWQKSQLINIEAAVKNGDMDGQRYAYLYDRIKMNGDEKQLYGTQFEVVDRKENIYQLAPTEDLDNLDKRRKEIGLMPIDMYKKFHSKYSGVTTL